MRARYTIFPKAGYILETFCGAVTFTQFEDFVLRQRQDSRILPQYHTVSDYTQATLRLSITEVEEIARLMCDSLNFRNGKRALVINGSRNFAFADVFRNCIEQADIIAQCFSYREAALNWVTQVSWYDETRSCASYGIFR